jgi:hypothetical protein
MKENRGKCDILAPFTCSLNVIQYLSTSLLFQIALFDFYLTFEDMTAIDGLNKNRRYNDPGDFCEPGMGTFCPIYE